MSLFRRVTRRSVVAASATALLMGTALAGAPGASATTPSCGAGETAFKSADANFVYCQAIFTADGTFTPPATVSSVDVLVVGAGGAGGGNAVGKQGGSGGQGGEVKVQTAVTVVPGTAVTIALGAASSGAGTSSTFASSTPVTAVGGAAGADGGSAFGNGGDGGAGLVPSALSGGGGAGGDGVQPNGGLFSDWSSNTTGRDSIPLKLAGGGGRGAPSGFNPGQGNGGWGPYGGGNGGDDAATGTTGTSGVSGAANTGGGGGGAGQSGDSATTGGPGGSGLVVVRYKIAIPAAPAITNVSPSSFGPGTVVGIYGNNLSGATVDIDGTAITLNSNLAGQITFTGPTLASSGTKTLTVTTAGGTANFSVTYTLPTPTLTSVTVLGGPTNPSNPMLAGSTVTISGTYLSGGTVTIDGVTAPTTSTSATQIVCTAPSLSTTGAKLVVVTVNGSSVPDPNSYGLVYYRAAPAPTPDPGGGTGGGGSSSSSSSSDSTPAATSPSSSGSSTATAPAPVAVTTPPASGSTEVVVGGVPVQVTTSTVPPASVPGTTGQGPGAPPRGVVPNGVGISGPGFTASVVGPTAAGPEAVPGVRVMGNTPVSVETTGFSPGGAVATYLIISGQPPILLGSSVAGPDGAFVSTVAIPSSATAGAGTIQIVGTTSSNQPLVLNLGVNVLPAVAPQSRANGELPDLAPGRSIALDESGKPQQVRVTQPETGGLRFTVPGGTTATIVAERSGKPQPNSTDGPVVLDKDSTVGVSGRGFAPYSQVEVWAFSEPTFIGFVQTDAKGEYRASLPMPASLKAGEHTVQSNGTARTGKSVSIATGVIVKQQPGSSGSPSNSSGDSSSPDGNTSVPNADPSKGPKTVKESIQVRFERMSASLSATDRKALAAIVAKVKGKNPSTVVVGYVQESDDRSNDQSLSLARAEAVAAALRKAGLTGPIKVKALGVRKAASADARTALVTIRYQR